MTKGQSRLQEFLGVKKRALEEQLAPRRKMVEILKQAGVIPRNWTDPALAVLLKKFTTSRGGRSRIATDKQRFYLIGSSVDQVIPRFESAFTFLKQLKVNGNSDLNTYRTELSKIKLTYDEIDSVLLARMPRGAAKRFVAKSLRISLSTVNSCYSRYLKASKSKCIP